MNKYSMRIPGLFILVFILLFSISLGGVPRKNATPYEEENTTWIYPPRKDGLIVIARQKHLTLFTLGKAKFLNPQGMDAVRLIETNDPERAGDDEEVTVYGVNTGENSIIYNPTMTSIKLYGYNETGEGMLDTPWDIAATPGGLVFVTDAGNHRIVKLRNSDGKLSYDTSFTTPSYTKKGGFRGIDVTFDGLVLVADAFNNSVVIFDTAGNFIKELTGFNSPVGLAAVDDSDTTLRPVGRKPYFVVTDSGGMRISKWSFDGELLASVDGTVATGFGEVYFGHVEIELYHNIVVTDSINNCIHKFDSKLNHLNRWGTVGRGRARFEAPTGITLNRWFGQAFISESAGSHYLQVGTDFASEPQVTILQDTPGVEINLTLTSNSRIELTLIDSSGNERGFFKTVGKAGNKHIKWKWKPFPSEENITSVKLLNSMRQGPFAPGDYDLQIRIISLYSSQTVFSLEVIRKLRIQY